MDTNLENVQELAEDSNDFRDVDLSTRLPEYYYAMHSTEKHIKSTPKVHQIRVNCLTFNIISLILN